MNTSDSPHHKIKRLRITGGFLEGLDIEFLDGLNCIIGPRGVGKTTVIELMRFAVDSMPGREGDPLRKRIERIISANLDGGKVEVTIETNDGVTYAISRSEGDDPIVMDAEGQPVAGLKVRRGRIFRADVLSQNQMESIAEKTHYQLDLIDKFSDGETGRIEWEAAALRAEIEENATEMLPLLTKVQSLTSEIKELPEIEQKLKGMQLSAGPNADAINSAHAHKGLRDRETRAIGEMRRILQDLSRTTRGVEGRMQAEIDSLFPEEMLAGPNAETIGPIVHTLTEASTRVDASLTEIITIFDDVSKQLDADEAVLEAVHTHQEAEFRQVIDNHKEAQARSSERTALAKRHNELLFKTRELAEVTRQRDEVEAARKEKLARLSDLFDERFRVRQIIAADLSRELGPAIRVRVEQCGNRDSYREHLEGLFRIPAIKGAVVARKISDAVPPLTLVEKVRAGDRESLITTCGLNENQATEVFTILSRVDNLLALEIVELDDAPAIELCERGDYRETSALSTGQKCTAILPILLFDSINPLIIDQPEDNLDNSYVYETVVRSIRKAKAGRQMIFATHNPNIPVLGDAARVFVMDSSRIKGSVLRQGDVDCCKADIVTILEGGEEAFRMRKERYQY